VKQQNASVLRDIYFIKFGSLLERFDFIFVLKTAKSFLRQRGPNLTEIILYNTYAMRKKNI